MWSGLSALALCSSSLKVFTHTHTHVHTHLHIPVYIHTHMHTPIYLIHTRKRVHTHIDIYTKSTLLFPGLDPQILNCVFFRYECIYIILELGPNGFHSLTSLCSFLSFVSGLSFTGIRNGLSVVCFRFAASSRSGEICLWVSKVQRA